MTEAERIVDLVDRSYTAKAWHGPALKETLDGIDAAKASARSIPSAHTIWELVLHVSAWVDVIRRRLGGEALKEPLEGDFPNPAEATEEAWRSDLRLLDERHAALLNALSTIDDSRLEQPITEGTKASVYINAQGAAHHYIYHGGQIALLKKML